MRRLYLSLYRTSTQEPKWRRGQQAAVLQQADAAYRALEVQDLANLPPFGNNQPLPPPVLPVTPDQSEQGRTISAPLTTPAAPPNIVTSTPPMSNPQPLPIPPPIVNPIQQQSAQDLIYAASMSKQLADNMMAAGMGTAAPGYAAHHIVAWGDGRFPEAQQARDVLTRFGIGINDAVNGVYLPTSQAIANTTGEQNHRTVHSQAYNKELLDRLQAATSPLDVVMILDKIRTELKNGTFPN